MGRGARRARCPGRRLQHRASGHRPHAASPLAARIALRCLATDGEPTQLSYADLRRNTNRFANGLRALGVAPGERGFVVAGRVAPLYVAVLGSLKAGNVVTPLFSAFGPEPIATRLGIAQASVLVTTEALYRRKVEKIRDRLGSLGHVILVGEGGTASAVPGTLDYRARLSRAPDDDPAVHTRADDLALLHAAPAEGPRARAARRRPVDARVRRAAVRPA